MSVRLLLTDEAWAEIASVLTAIKSRAGSPPAHVQGVRLNRTIFPRGGRPARVCDCMAL